MTLDELKAALDTFSPVKVEFVSNVVESLSNPPRSTIRIEIPVGIFDSIQQAPLKDFERDAPVITCRIGNEVVARVAIDRSDAKITVRGIQLSACTVHAEWQRS